LNALWGFLTSPFWFTAFTATIIIRVIADYLKKRVYWQTGGRQIHLHHFLFGLALTPVTWLLFYYDFLTLGSVTSGLVAALIASETKELILQRWKK